jgi:hypothetical protein
MGDDVVIQTRVPPEIGAELAFIASDNGESTAAWVRRLIFREINLARVKAWVAPSREDPVKVFTKGGPHKYLLHPCRHITALVRTFKLTDPFGTSIQTHMLIEQPWYQKPSQFRFVLDRSPSPWRIISILTDEITLRVEVDHFQK